MLTDFQKRVLATIAKHRSPESVVAGGSALNRDRPRLSRDLDIFHEAIQAVHRCAELDIETLRAAGFVVEPVAGFARGRVEAIVRGDDPDAFTTIDWAVESAFRFFPAVSDPEFGWRLHDADLAVNKLLALAGRQEPRDIADVVDLHQRGYPVVALAWAAPAKDPGFTPFLILDEISRNSRVDPARLEAEILSGHPIDVVAMKEILLNAIREAREIFARLPPDQMGCLYLDDRADVAMPDAVGVTAGRLRLHRASLRGAWPTLSSDGR